VPQRPPPGAPDPGILAACPVSAVLMLPLGRGHALALSALARIGAPSPERGAVAGGSDGPQCESSGEVLKCRPAPPRTPSWPFAKDQARSRSGICEAGGEVHKFLGFYLRRRRLAQQTRRWWSSFFRMTSTKLSRLARI
jgi:hypothetical protein